MQNLVRILVFLFITHFVRAQDNGTIELSITNIESDEGQMVIGLYSAEDNWLNKIYKGTFGQIEDGKSTITFANIPDGTYAISVFHDEDNNGKLETNFFGIPKEDTGSSNNAPARFGPPKWEDAKFEVKGGVVKQIINL